MIGGLLDARATALREDDRAGWLDAVDRGSTARGTRFRAQQARLFDRIRGLRAASWSYQVAGGYPLSAERRAELRGTAWLADVQLEYRLTADGPLVRRQQFLTVVRRADGWLIADDTDGSTTRDVWDLGPITRAASSRCVVIGAQDRRAQVEQLAQECGTSATTVDGAWGTSWARRTVLTVPGTVTQLAVLLGRTTGPEAPPVSEPAQTRPGSATASPRQDEDGDSTAGDEVADTAGLDETAAVTVGPADGPADGVLINGDAFDRLSPAGRRVVLTHELVHVATRATGAVTVATWLAEGFADEVAYAGSGLSAQQVAGEALDAVRAGAVPAALPAPDEFDAAGDEAAAAYGRAWVAASLIAARAGTPERMKSFYEQAATPDGLDPALAALNLGGTAPFTRIWQARLRTLAR